MNTYPVDVHVTPALVGRNRLTCAFRLILAIPHILLVGGPAGFAVSLGWYADPGSRVNWGGGAGVLGAVAAVVALIGWFAIVFGGSMPRGLWDMTAFYMRWRVRAVAYMTLLRDEYPPFGDGPYPATLTLSAPDSERNRLTVAFRIFLVIPHFIALWVLSVGWALTTIFAWLNILILGNYPAAFYYFAVGVLRWSTRVESYVLLLHDEYPPFTLE